MKLNPQILKLIVFFERDCLERGMPTLNGICLSSPRSALVSKSTFTWSRKRIARSRLTKARRSANIPRACGRDIKEVAEKAARISRRRSQFLGAFAVSFTALACSSEIMEHPRVNQGKPIGVLLFIQRRRICCSRVAHPFVFDDCMDHMSAPVPELQECSDPPSHSRHRA